MTAPTSSPATRPMAVRPREAAHMLGLGRTSIFELLRTGELEAARIGAATLIPVASIEAFITRHARRATLAKPATSGR